MSIRTLHFATLMLVFFAGAGAVGAQVAPGPHIFFTDIITGANSGGENGNGVYITIYGKNFGASQGSSTVTVGGAPVVQYKIWGSHNGINPALDKVVVQIGPGNSTGNIVMTVGGQQSNSMPFTVCNGHVYSVSPSGKDSNNGSFAAPWLTTGHARASMVAGDTVYVRAGTYTTEDSFGASFMCNSGCIGNASAYINYVGYPGETANLGGGVLSRSFLVWGSGVAQFVTFAELTGRTTDYTFTCDSAGGGHCDWLRVVGNDLRTLHSQSVAVDFEMPASNIDIYGNESSLNCQGDSGCSFDSRAYSVYMGGYGTQTNVDIGWNSLHDNPFGKGIQIYGHTAVDTISGLKIHDNAIFNNTMEGILVGGCDGGCTEFVRDAQIYNNLLWHNNFAADPGHKNYGDIEISGSSGTIGDYQFYNNTFYNSSPSGTGFSSGSPISFAIAVHSAAINNNVFYVTSGAPCYIYFDYGSVGSPTYATLSHNLYFNAGKGPTACNYNVGSIPVNADSSAVNADPKFLNFSTADYHLTLGSPAIDAGMNTGDVTDYDGNSRPQGAAYDIGAYEFLSGTSSNRPAPPTNVGAVVH